MIDKTLREKRLEAPLIISGFVNNEPNCNYELYLTEVINHSGLFMSKSGGTSFHWVESQNHGECDAASSNYSIDFKILATRSSLQALRETSESITKYADGFIGFGQGRYPQGKKFTYLRTVAVLRQYSYEDLLRIASSPNHKRKDEIEVSIILKSLRAKKNLLLFYPYSMSFSEPRTFEKGCTIIEEAFNGDMHNICSYRRTEAPDFDTFLCAVFQNRLLVFEDDCCTWKLKDSVDMFSSRIYKDLYYSYGNGGLNGAIIEDASTIEVTHHDQL